MGTELVDALLRGDWNPQVMGLIADTLKAGVRFRHIPSINGHVEWDEEDYRDLLGEFLARGRGPARMLQLAAKATTDTHLSRLLDVTVKNFLTDLAREDPLPKVHRTLRAVMANMHDVEADSEHACCDPYGNKDPWPAEGSDELLLRVAKRVNVAAPPYGDTARREGPPTDRDSFDRLCRAILEAAQRPVPLSTLTRIVGLRLRVRERWDDGLPDEWEVLRPIAASSAPITPPAFVLARGIWEDLDDDQRRLLPFLDGGGRSASAQSAVHLGKSAAHDKIEKLKLQLRVALEDVDDQAGVIAALVSMSDDWKEEADED